MIAIRVRYLPATNTKGARVKAHDGRGNQVIMSYGYGDHHEREQAAVQALCVKMDWRGELVEGFLGGAQEESVWVFLTFPNGANTNRLTVGRPTSPATYTTTESEA